MVFWMIMKLEVAPFYLHHRPDEKRASLSGLITSLQTLRCYLIPRVNRLDSVLQTGDKHRVYTGEGLQRVWLAICSVAQSCSWNEDGKHDGSVLNLKKTARAVVDYWSKITIVTDTLKYREDTGFVKATQPSGGRKRSSTSCCKNFPAI